MKAKNIGHLFDTGSSIIILALSIMSSLKQVVIPFPIFAFCFYTLSFEKHCTGYSVLHVVVLSGFCIGNIIKVLLPPRCDLFRFKMSLLLACIASNLWLRLLWYTVWCRPCVPLFDHCKSSLGCFIVFILLVVVFFASILIQFERRFFCGDLTPFVFILPYALFLIISHFPVVTPN